jgi:hypothetical protein
MMRRRAWVLLNVLVLLTACGTTLGVTTPTPTPVPTPEAVGKVWGDAIVANDFAVLRSMMQGDEFTFSIWAGDVQRAKQRQRMQAYTMTGTRAAGTSTDVMMTWTGGDAPPICTTIQVGPDSKIVLYSGIYDCPE